MSMKRHRRSTHICKILFLNEVPFTCSRMWALFLGATIQTTTLRKDKCPCSETLGWGVCFNKHLCSGLSRRHNYARHSGGSMDESERVQSLFSNLVEGIRQEKNGHSGAEPEEKSQTSYADTRG